MKRYYLHIALMLCGLTIFVFGFLIADYNVVSDIKAVEDWTRGYRYGVFKTRYEVWKKYGITEFGPNPPQPEQIEIEIDLEEGDIDHSEI